MSKIEKLVIFKTPKELEETKKELEENFHFRFSTQLRRMKLGLDMDWHSQGEDAAVAYILCDMQNIESVLWAFNMCCGTTEMAAKALYANTIGCVLMSLKYLMVQGTKNIDVQNSFFGWIESKNKEEEFSTYQNRIKALKKKKREVEKVRAESDGDHPATLICPYEYIPSISFNKNVSDFLTPLFEKAIENIVIYERDSVSWNILRLAQKEKIIYFQENANKSQRSEIRDICADLCNAVKRMEAIDLRQNTKSETIILSFARELMYHCEAVKSILEKGEQTSENRTIQKKADIEKNLQIVRNTTYPAAFYLDKIKVDKMYGKPIREKYCRYIRIVAVAIVEYAHIRLEENGIEATLQNSIKEAYRILGHYVDSIWNDYFSFFDEKQQEEYQKPKLSTEMVRAIYCIFLCGDTIYDVPLNTGIIPQSLADERPSLENQKIETVTFRNSREAKIAVMNWEPHATGQLNVRLMINHSGVKVDRGTRNKKWMEFMKVMEEQSLLEVEEDRVIYNFLNCKETWETFLSLFGKTTKAFCVKDFQIEVVPKSKAGYIEILSGSKSPSAMRRVLENKGALVDKRSGKIAEPEITYKWVIELLYSISQNKNPLWEGTTCVQLNLGKLKACHGSDNYLLCFEWEEKLTMAGKILKHDMEKQ